KLNYEILNFAVPGYNTAMEAETFKKRASAFSPDLVLLQFDINDLVLPNFVLAPRDMWTLKRCYLWGLVEKLVKGRDAGKGLKEAAFDDLQKAPETEESREQGLVKYFEYRAQSTPQQYKEIVGWDGVKRALNSLWNDSNQPVVHLSWTYQLFRKKRKGVEQRDHFSNFIKDAQKKREDGARLHYLDIMTVGKEFCRETGLRFARDLVVNYPVDYHPSEVRHILFARKIYLFLVEKRLLPENSLHYEKFESIAESLWQQARALVPQPRGMGSLPGAKLLLLPTWWGKV
ncbi:MAG: SGNH/GDSL hydrolase family protein, partial [bacterium]|nr:SGNH/GDSL hydrolase family protein [bacterium]